MLSITNGTWDFTPAVAEGFTNHIERSVPLYRQGHEFVALLAEEFLIPGSTAYDIGCSTGELMRTVISKSERARSSIWVGIDEKQAMCDKAISACAGFDNIQIVQSDVRDINFKESSFIVDYLSLQFLPYEERVSLISRISDSLQSGGAFYMYSKIFQSSSDLQVIAERSLERFKLWNGFSPAEILAKAHSLSGVLHQVTETECKNLLHDQGFRLVERVFGQLSFAGFLAVK